MWMGTSLWNVSENDSVPKVTASVKKPLWGWRASGHCPLKMRAGLKSGGSVLRTRHSAAAGSVVLSLVNRRLAVSR
jgi:hypothetical protein